MRGCCARALLAARPPSSFSFGSHTAPPDCRGPPRSGLFA
jgi:hypothetical protein